jgi:hypothetical protein
MKQSAVALKMAGAVALAGSSQAYGQIISLTALPANILGTPQSASTSPTVEFYDLTNGTSTATNTGDDTLEFAYINGTNNGYAEFSTGVIGFNGGDAAAYLYSGTGNAYAYAVPKGTKIGSGSPYKFRQVNRFTDLSLVLDGTAYGIQHPNTDEYLGFQFLDSTDNMIHDGYLELDSEPYTSASSPGGLIFIAGAYNALPADAPLGAGAITAGEPATIPEPGTVSALLLGATALGAVGLMRRRRAHLSVSPT